MGLPEGNGRPCRPGKVVVGVGDKFLDRFGCAVGSGDHDADVPERGCVSSMEPADPQPREGDSLVVAERLGQKITISKAEKVARLVMRLDDRMVNLDEPVSVEQGGKVLYTGRPQRTMRTLVETLADRGDPRLMFDAELAVDLQGPAPQ